jgi:HTH-type transcriptional regulator/antitoxin HipB
MSQKKTETTRRSWASMKRAKADSEARRLGYRQAKGAFELAERVREARERIQMTQAELAKRIGSTQPAIARLEAGGSTPSFDTLRRIAAALELELVVELRPRRAAA